MPAKPAAALAALIFLAACSSALPPAGPKPTTTATASTTTTTSGPAPPSTSTTTCTDAQAIAGWTLARKAAELIVVPVDNADPAAIAVARAQNAGGILLLGQVPPPSALRVALAPLRGHSMVMTDEEGGGVQRLRPDVGSIPWPRTMASTMTPAQVRATARTLGAQMLQLGVGVDLAPVVDVDGGPDLSSSDPDGPRSFSPQPGAAATYASAFAQGLRDAGVLSVLKHFPGLGGSTGNTDYGPAATVSIDQLRRTGLPAFEQSLAAGAPAVMVANATVPGLTSKPASVSPQVIGGLLRDQLGFNGLVMTDSLSAGAIRSAGYTVPSAAAAAIAAGADMVLFGSTLTPADTAALAPGRLQQTTQSIVAAIVAATQEGAIPAARLDAAVGQVVTAENAKLC